MPKLPFPCPLTEATITAQRALVLETVLTRFPALRACPPLAVPPEALRCMLVAYDHVFFEDFLARRAPQLTISASTRMTRAAGTCRVTRSPFAPPHIEIRMGVDFLLRLPKEPVEANGLVFATPLEAFLSVLEHELCHAADFLLSGKLHGHGPAFRVLTHGLFSHQRSTHALPTRAQEAAQQGLLPGRWVHFAYQGATLRGRLTRVGKTAGVLVPDPRGAWRDASGARYTKYNVPVARLTLEQPN